MAPLHSRLPRLSALVAWTLAATVAAGVAMPRLRVAARERVVRAGLTTAGSVREGTRGWTVPLLFQPDAAAAIGEPPVRQEMELPAVVPGGWRPAAPAAAALPHRRQLPRPFVSFGPPPRPGRAPPLA